MSLPQRIRRDNANPRNASVIRTSSPPRVVIHPHTDMGLGTPLATRLHGRQRVSRQAERQTDGQLGLSSRTTRPPQLLEPQRGTRASPPYLPLLDSQPSHVPVCSERLDSFGPTSLECGSHCERCGVLGQERDDSSWPSQFHERLDERREVRQAHDYSVAQDDVGCTRPEVTSRVLFSAADEGHASSNLFRLDPERLLHDPTPLRAE